MSNYSKIYWLTRLDALQGLFIVMAVASFLFTVFYLLYCHIEDVFEAYDEDDKAEAKSAKRRLNFAIVIGFFFALLSVFVPTKNEAILIIAGGKTMDFIEADSSLNKIPGQATTIISGYLDEKIKELKESK